MTATLLLLALAAAIIAAVLAPLETLEWWAGWTRDEATRGPAGFDVPKQPHPSNKRLFVVFLDGIARAGTEENIAQVGAFVRNLRSELPDAEVINDLFPYSVLGRPLTQQRPLSRFWRFADGRKRVARISAIGFMINLRNLLQVAVSADRRYAPLYFQGEAQLLINTLQSRGFDPAAPVPVVLIGYSGGAQMAAGAAPYLQDALGVPVRVISIGGVMSAVERIGDLRRLEHLEGSRDWVQKLGAILFPRRWRLAPLSRWQRARREGRIRICVIGPMTHIGKGSYVDPNTSYRGQPHDQVTLAETLERIHGAWAHELASESQELRQGRDKNGRRAESAVTGPATPPEG